MHALNPADFCNACRRYLMGERFRVETKVQGKKFSSWHSVNLCGDCHSGLQSAANS